MGYRNILLIDDDVDDQEIFLSATSEISGNINCLALTDASEALKKLEAKDLSPEVIFLDLNMPIMTGEEFLIQIKKNDQLSNIPIIIFSTSSHPKTIKVMKDLGAYDFVSKPDKFDKLINILKPFLA